MRSILEMGIGDGQRALRILELASQHCPASEIRYTGVDLFEANPSGEAHLSLKKTRIGCLRPREPRFNSCQATRLWPFPGRQTA